KLTKEERKMQKQAKETAQYISKWGKAAAIVFSARRMKLKAARGVLLRNQGLTDALFESVIEAERKALRRKFWSD
ncbi:hypothetical protein KAU87_04215, partial [Candidatus Bathyarchaeota archaeon]|nr:hypothetical protein [Candidatus Bathyarchaeota archaeon]